MAMLTEGEILGDEVGFLGEKSPDNGPNDPEKEIGTSVVVQRV